MVAYICFAIALIILWDTLSCPFAENAYPHVYLRLLANLPPPSSRQPGPVAVGVIFFGNLSYS